MNYTIESINTIKNYNIYDICQNHNMDIFNYTLKYAVIIIIIYGLYILFNYLTNRNIKNNNLILRTYKILNELTRNVPVVISIILVVEYLNLTYNVILNNNGILYLITLILLLLMLRKDIIKLYKFIKNGGLNG